MGGKGRNPLFLTSKVSSLRTYNMLREAPRELGPRPSHRWSWPGGWMCTHRPTAPDWSVVLLLAFASMTPAGLVLGGVAKDLQPDWLPIFKACVLSLGAGTFLYMGTLHELKHAPMIQYCKNPHCFLIMVSGFTVTALVRWIMGEAHHM